MIALQHAVSYVEDPNLDADPDRIDIQYLNGRGEFLVGELDGKIVTMGASRRLSDTTSELKRRRVHPDLQRRGHGTTMLRALERRAKDLGYTTIELDTKSNAPAQSSISYSLYDGPVSTNHADKGREC
jgi:ribosomal protein S18 acetylase RimI-like enzyme